MSYHQFSLIERKARKQYRCIWCGQSISEEETYEHEQSIYDGRHQNHRWHPECLDGSSEYFKHEEEFEAHGHDRPSKNPLDGPGSP